MVYARMKLSKMNPLYCSINTANNYNKYLFSDIIVQMCTANLQHCKLIGSNPDIFVVH